MRDTSEDVTNEANLALAHLMVLVDPEVQGLLDEHLEFYDELLITVFFGDLASWAIGEGKSPAVVSATNCLYVVGSSHTQNIVEVGFCEGVPPEVTDEQVALIPEPLRSRVRYDLRRLV